MSVGEAVSLDALVDRLAGDGLRARRPGGGARRPVGARRHPRRLPLHRRPARAHRALRRRGREHAGVLGVHPAHDPADHAAGRLARGRAAARRTWPTRSPTPGPAAPRWCAWRRPSTPPPCARRPSGSRTRPPPARCPSPRRWPAALAALAALDLAPPARAPGRPLRRRRGALRHPLGRRGRGRAGAPRPRAGCGSCWRSRAAATWRGRSPGWSACAPGSWSPASCPPPARWA